MAAISGVNGVYSDEDISKVRKLALRARKDWKAAHARKKSRKRPRTRKAG